jgi:hypothetical protein
VDDVAFYESFGRTAATFSGGRFALAIERETGCGENCDQPNVITATLTASLTVGPIPSDTALVDGFEAQRAAVAPGAGSSYLVADESRPASEKRSSRAVVHIVG